MMRAIVKHCAMPILPLLSLVLTVIAVAVEANPRANDRFLGISKLILNLATMSILQFIKFIMIHVARKYPTVSLPAAIFLFQR